MLEIRIRATVQFGFARDDQVPASAIVECLTFMVKPQFMELEKLCTSNAIDSTFVIQSRDIGG